MSLKPNSQSSDLGQQNLPEKIMELPREDLVLGFEKIPNPFFSRKADELSKTEEFKDNPITTLFSEECNLLKLSVQPDYIPERKSNAYIPFKSDLELGSPIPNPKNQLSISTAAAYFYDEMFEPKNDPVDVQLKLSLKSTQVITFDVMKFEMACESVEPITCTAYLYDGNSKRIISEHWDFAPEQSVHFFEDVGMHLYTNPKAGFQYAELSPSVSLVILLHRVVQIESGKKADAYYANPKPKTLDAAIKSVEQSWPRCKESFTTFAYTAAPLTSIVGSLSGYTFDTFYSSKGGFDGKSIDEVVSQFSSEGKRKSHYPFKIIMKPGIKSVQHAEELTDIGYKVIFANSKSVCEPNLQFRNQVVIRLESANFKPPSSKKPRNVYAVCFIQENLKGKPIPIIVDPHTGKHTASVTTLCSKRKCNPRYDDLITADLPSKLPRRMSMFAFFYNVAVDTKKDDGRFIGVSEFPLVVDGLPVTNGQYTCGVSYDPEIPESGVNPANSASADIMFHSSIFPNDRALCKLFNSLRDGKVDMESLQNAGTESLVHNLFQLVALMTMCITTDPDTAIEGLLEVARRVQPVYERLDAFTVGFATHFPSDPAMMQPLLNSWIASLSKIDTGTNGSLRFDVFIVDFLFILMTRSLHLGADSSSLKEFVKLWLVSVKELSYTGLLQAKRMVTSFARFAASASDADAINCVETAVDTFTDSPGDIEVLCHFLSQALTPRIFGLVVFRSDAIFKLVKRGVHAAACRPFVEFFELFLKNFTRIGGDFANDVADKCVPLLKVMSPLSSIPFVATELLHPAIVVFVWIMGNCRERAARLAFTDDLSELYKSLHYLMESIVMTNSVDEQKQAMTADLHALERRYSTKGAAGSGRRSFKAKKDTLQKKKDSRQVATATTQKLREIVYSTQFAVLSFTNILATLGRDTEQILSLYLHLISSNISIDIVPKALEGLSRFICRNTKSVFKSRKPSLARVFGKVFELTMCTNVPLTIMEEVFKAEGGGAPFSTAEALRAIEMTDIFKFDARLFADSPFRDLSLKIMECDKLIDSADIQEDIADAYLKKSELYAASPDARVSVLKDLANFNKENMQVAEQIQCLLFAAAIIADCLISSGQIDPEGIDFKSFSTVCPSAAALQKRPKVPPPHHFSFLDLVEVLNEVSDVAIEDGYFEVSQMVSELLWPLLEQNRSYGALSSLFEKQKECMKGLARIDGEERLFGRFYRVTFLDGDTSSTYIYREPKFMNLYKLAERLEKGYEGKRKAVVLKDSKDPPKDDGVLYIRVTYVEPFFGKSEMRSTAFSRAHDVTRFYFDTPFTKGGKSQGNVGEQFLRRTVLTVSAPMPSLIKRCEVREVVDKEIEPIKVSYKALRTRTELLIDGLAKHDAKTVQQLLHGNLLVQVNEGPSKMAEVFLSGGAKGKREAKLRQAFDEFIAANEEGLALHREYVSENAQFMAMQHELESGMTILREKLAQYQ